MTICHCNAMKTTFSMECTEYLNFCISAELKMEIIRARDIRQNTEKQLQNEHKNKGEKEEDNK